MIIAQHCSFFGKWVTAHSLPPHHLLSTPAPAVPLACLPLGVDPQEHETKLTSVTPTEDLLHSILSVSSAPVPTDLDEEAARSAIVDTPVMGFLYVYVLALSP